MVKSPELTATQITDVTAKVIKLLGPLSSGERQKVIQASLTLLGEQGDASSSSNRGLGFGNGIEMGATKAGHITPGISPRAATWLRQNGITTDQLETVFDIADGGAGLIAELQGKSSKENTLNAYVLYGIAKFLPSGDVSFDDKAARALCVSLGCYNSANHAVYMNAKGNLFTGSKDKGWKLTAPGLKRGAELIKTLSQGK